MLSLLMQMLQLYALVHLIRSSFFPPSVERIPSLSEKADIVFVMNELAKKADKSDYRTIESDENGSEVSIGADASMVSIGKGSLTSRQNIHVGLISFGRDGINISRNPRIVFRDNGAAMQLIDGKLCLRDGDAQKFDFVSLSDVLKKATENSDRITTNKMNHEDLQAHLKKNYLTKSEIVNMLKEYVTLNVAARDYVTKEQLEKTEIELAGYEKQVADSIFVSKKLADDTLVTKELLREELLMLEDSILNKQSAI